MAERRLRLVAGVYAVLLGLAALTNYIPGITDEQGRAFGIFALDLFDDLLHLASASWALIAALVSARAAWVFLRVFGVLYLLDGLMGLAVGSGYLDLGIVFYGVLDLQLSFRILANTPHILLGGGAVLASIVWRNESK